MTPFNKYQEFLFTKCSYRLNSWIILFILMKTNHEMNNKGALEHNIKTRLFYVFKFKENQITEIR